MSRKRKNQMSGKDAAAGEEREEEGGVATAEAPPKEQAPKADRMAEWVDGVTKIVAVGDRALLKLAATAVKGAAKRGKSLNAGLDIAKGEADLRMNQADAILQAIKGTDNRKEVTVAPHLLRCAQIGVSFLIEKAVKLRESEKDDVGVEDTKTMDNQLLTLERLARDLGMEGQLWEEPEEKEAEESDQEELDVD